LAEAEQKPKIILFGDMSSNGLVLAKPTLRAELLEERVKALAPLVLALRDREAACDGLAPCPVVSEARPAGPGLFKNPGPLVLIKDVCLALSHVKPYLLGNPVPGRLDRYAFVSLLQGYLTKGYFSTMFV